MVYGPNCCPALLTYICICPYIIAISVGRSRSWAIALSGRSPDDCMPENLYCKRASLGGCRPNLLALTALPFDCYLCLIHENPAMHCLLRPCAFRVFLGGARAESRQSSIQQEARPLRSRPLDHRFQPLLSAGGFLSWRWF